VINVIWIQDIKKINEKSSFLHEGQSKSNKVINMIQVIEMIKPYSFKKKTSVEMK